MSLVGGGPLIVEETNEYQKDYNIAYLEDKEILCQNT